MTQTLAPELPSTLQWLNAATGSLHDQRGKAVALAFVNAGSAWSAQRLAELTVLQARYPGRLQVLVIHVPRFDSERDPQRVLKRLRRQGVTLPVTHDADWVAWQRFEVDAWPTVLLIDGEGVIRHRLVGLDVPGELERAVSELCDALQMPYEDDLVPFRENNPEPRLALRFPMGLAVTADRLYVADSGHHRVLECSHAGQVLRQFGTGAADFVDGDGAQAAFRRPQGLALLRESLYVADTGNHALRRINLANGSVDTLCGNGRAGAVVEGVVSAPRDVVLNHPAAVTLVGNRIHLAMAGDNRIWSYDLGSRELLANAGSGKLDVRDGSGTVASFGQPAGLAAVQQMLYVCDELGSSLRAVQLRNDLVQTLVGSGPWEFGEVDGPRETARLQQPQAIALSPGVPQLWVADSGNGRLRTLRLGGGELSTVALPRRLHGPAGLVADAEAVWIAETDAHAVLRYHIASGELSDVPITE